MDLCKIQLSLFESELTRKTLVAIVEFLCKNEVYNKKNRKTLYHNVFSLYFWKCQTKYNIS